MEIGVCYEVRKRPRDTKRGATPCQNALLKDIKTNQRKKGCATDEFYDEWFDAVWVNMNTKPVSCEPVQTSSPSPTQEEIDEEAWEIFLDIAEKHSATWTELAKY
jgi:hypothetical protein